MLNVFIRTIILYLLIVVLMQFQDGPNLDMYIQSVVFTWLPASLAAILDLCPNLESTEISKTNKDSS